MYLVSIYLVITTVILIKNWSDFNSLPDVPHNFFSRDAPTVSICIPARNEEISIERCVRSAVNQKYPNVQIIVLDDNSTDETPRILNELSAQFPEKLSVIKGSPKPDDWLGKAWACHQLSKQAKGDFLIFIDADTWLEPLATARMLRSMGKDVVDFATIWPQQKMETFWEKIVIPIVYFIIFTLLAVRYVRQPPTWFPFFLRKKTAPFFAAACGQFMAFRKEAYHKIGGHESVKKEVAEDMALAKNLKRAGYSMDMYHGRQAVTCRMYHSHKEIWEGFRKNFLAVFGGNIFLFVIIGLLQFLTYIAPVITLLLLILFKSSSSLLLLSLLFTVWMFIQRAVIDRWFSWSYSYGLLHPLGIFWFFMLGIQVLSDHINGYSVQWKDREL